MSSVPTTESRIQKNAISQKRLGLRPLLVAATMVTLAAFILGQATSLSGPLSFQPPTTIQLYGSYSTFSAVADINRDGRPDLIVPSNGTVDVLLGNGDGTFQPPFTIGGWRGLLIIGGRRGYKRGRQT